MSMIRSIATTTDFSPGSDVAVDGAVQLALARGASLRLTMNPLPNVRLRQHARLGGIAGTAAARTTTAISSGRAAGRCGGSNEARPDSIGVSHA